MLEALLAPLCWKLRADVAEAVKDPESPLVQLAKDWRQLLFPDASDERFADSYAQTVTFALLLARSEGADPLTLATAQAALLAEHTLLSRALQVLTDPNAQAEISASLDLLIRVIGAVPSSALKGPEDPWLYFYEDFLAVYDPRLRKDIGAYYTPVEVVRAQVRLIDDLLTNRLGKPLGFADRGVVTLDPAVGTGTYLLGVIQHALEKVESREGPGAVAGQATTLGRNIYGFEILVGPFAVSELRISRALEDKGAELPSDGTHIYLTDTLESPHTTPPQLPLYLKPISDQHAKALQVKDNVPVIICLGNPPYDRHEAADPNNLARTGGWVRYGDPLPTPKAGRTKKAKGKIRDADAVARSVMKERELQSILYKSFLKPAIDAGHGGDLKNAYNLYVYFWRWALWKVFERTAATGPGVVSYISASSYLDGDAFSGMREHMRRLCDEIWIIDLGGEGRGTRKTENVFAIQTPVAVAISACYGKPDNATPAKVWYATIDGTRARKLQALDSIQDFSSLKWQKCPTGWHAPFRPAGKGKYFEWSLLTDLFPWQHSGVKAGRTWVISPDQATLERRWCELCKADSDKRAALFKNSPTGQKAHFAPLQLPPSKQKLKPISEQPRNAPAPKVVRYAYRSFDRQCIFADARMLDRPGPDLWAAHSEAQLYLSTLLNHPLGNGPAITAAIDMPDLHYFRGSYGAKEIVPLYRDAGCLEPNLRPGLMEALTKNYKRKVTAEVFLAYIYGLLAQPAFTQSYAKELSTRELRVPITSDAVLFAKVSDIGAKLLWLHTYGQRYVPKGRQRGHIPKGEARCTKPIPGSAAKYPEKYEYEDASKTLHVGVGAFSPVDLEVYNFEVSGLKVVQSWLGYRMRKPKGKKSSPLDDILPEKWTGDFTTELWPIAINLQHWPGQVHNIMGQGARHERRRLFDV
ncbi:MAG: N-6 DNA methylase, partial [Planctomycetes bacterium]|nr:N-6 DNA methylase [Planctomycetota bacterium]